MGEIAFRASIHSSLVRCSLMAVVIFGTASAWADSLAQRDFAIAKELLDSGKESEAQVSLTDFLRRHPTDALADDAQFNLGEIYFRKRQFSEAIAEFRKVAKYQKGDRLPDAFLRLGEAQKLLGNYREALIEFEAVRRRFPKTPQYDQALSLIDDLMKGAVKK
jgi:TolA-binding protein